jgi:hypothetical protein
MRFHPTLKTTLTTSFLAAACLPLIFAGTVLLYLFSDILKTEVNERHFTMAKTMAGEVNRFLNGYKRILEYIADRYTIEKSPIGYAQDRRLEALINRYRLFECVKVLDVKGRVVTLAPFREDHINLDQSGHSFIGKAMKAGEARWSNVYLSYRTGYPAVSLAIPFSSGMVVGDLNLNILQEITQEIKPGAGGYAAMVDRMGNVIATPKKIFFSSV